VFVIILFGFSQSFYFVIQDQDNKDVPAVANDVAIASPAPANATSIANSTETVGTSGPGGGVSAGGVCLDNIWNTGFVMYQLMLGDVPGCVLERIRSMGGTPQLLYIFYTLTTVLLLLNLLIAVFNDTYTDVKENAEVEWRATWAKTIMRIQAKLPHYVVTPWCTAVLTTCTLIEEKLPNAHLILADASRGTRDGSTGTSTEGAPRGRKRSYTVYDEVGQAGPAPSDMLAGVPGVTLVDEEGATQKQKGRAARLGDGTETTAQHLDRMEVGLDIKIEMLVQAQQQLDVKLTLAQQQLEAKLTLVQQNLDAKLTQVLQSLDAKLSSAPAAAGAVRNTTS
jgi:hypothetical protein